MKEQWKKQETGTKWRFLIVGIFLAGIVCMLWIDKLFSFQTTVFTLENCKTYVETEWNTMALFWDCLVKKLALYLGLFVLLYSKFGMKFLGVYVMWFVFCLGMSMELLAIAYGIWGMGLFIVGCFPQVYLYGTGFVLLYKMGNYIKREKRTNVVQFVVLQLVVIIGVFFESYVNPLLLKFFLNIFLERFYNI